MRPPATCCALDKTTTGDGLIGALQVLAIMKQHRPEPGRARRGHAAFPQVLLNVKVANRFDPGANAWSAKRCARSKRGSSRTGRVVLRASGTEPVIRVMRRRPAMRSVSRAACRARSPRSSARSGSLELP